MVLKSYMQFFGLAAISLETILVINVTFNYPQSHGRQKDHSETTFSTTLTAQRPLIFFFRAINSIRNHLNEDITNSLKIYPFKRRARREFWASLL